MRYKCSLINCRYCQPIFPRKAFRIVGILLLLEALAVLFLWWMIR